mmetsp:Transcript_12906/g.41240  ORF Transcript_12906/g.41240 Transcript_12906/m.41240 type:complete len:241 (+) Transcript_12906:16-738(+)
MHILGARLHSMHINARVAEQVSEVAPSSASRALSRAYNRLPTTRVLDACEPVSQIVNRCMQSRHWTIMSGTVVRCTAPIELVWNSAQRRPLHSVHVYASEASPAFSLRSISIARASRSRFSCRRARSCSEISASDARKPQNSSTEHRPARTFARSSAARGARSSDASDRQRAWYALPVAFPTALYTSASTATATSAAVGEPAAGWPSSALGSPSSALSTESASPMSTTACARAGASEMSA